ncbi:MAG: CHASE domain-containing protein [Acidimicrobiales bacterium]
MKRNRASVLPYIALAVGIACTLLSWTWLRHVEDRLAEEGFRAESRERLLVIEEQFLETSAGLEDLRSLYAISTNITAGELTTVVDPILDRNPAILGLSWNPVIQHEERSAYERTARDAGQPDFAVSERDSRGELVPAGNRDRYVVVDWIRPSSGNETAIGFDVYSEPTRRRALDEAGETGEFSVAMPLDLVQSQDGSRGALGFLPRYETTAQSSTLGQRSAGLLGYFVAVIDIGQTIESSLANLDPTDIDLRVLHQTGEQSYQLLYTADSSGGPTPRSGDSLPFGRNAGAELSTIETFEWGGNELGIEFNAGPSYYSEFRTLAPHAALFGGLLLTVLVAALLRSLLGRAGRIEHEVSERTQDLQHANVELEDEVRRRTAAEEALAAYRDDLERQVGERTAELEYTTTQLRAIVESEPECVKVITGSGELVDMNAAGLAMIEADSIEQVRGLNVYSLIAEADRDAFIALNERVMNGQSGTLEFDLEGLRGTTRHVETHAVPLVTADGEPPRHLAITRDVTQRVMAEQERSALEVQLRHSQKLKSVGMLAGGIAHDFNNLLQIIVGNTELAMASDHRGLPRLKATRDAAAEASRLCDQMLTYAGESRPNVRPVSLPRIVRSIVELLKVSLSKKIGLDIDMEEVGAIDGDDAQLGQVVLNLVTNASEAIGDTTGTVDVRVREVTVLPGYSGGSWSDSEPLPGKYISLEVSDTGSGISSDDLEVIFDPYYSTKFDGRGLGLSSTIGIVRSHSGHLSVSSEVGEGSRFQVLFPTSSKPVAASTEPDLDDGATFQRTVMLVDDQEQILKATGDLLENLGLRVLSAADGAEAVQTFERHAADIDIVILDVKMPRLNGYEVCAAMRASRPDLPVIFSSGYNADVPDVADVSLPNEAFTGFLHKPYQRADVVSALRDAERAAGWDGKPAEHAVPPIG